MRITVELLEEGGACRDQIKEFEQEWPDGVDPKLKDFRRAGELRLDAEWLFRLMEETSTFAERLVVDYRRANYHELNRIDVEFGGGTWWRNTECDEWKDYMEFEAKLRSATWRKLKKGMTRCES